jgi:hypothetical protein
MRRALILLSLFAIVTGYIEAAAVAYIRSIYEPIHARLFPERDPDDLLPLFTFEQWREQAPPYLRSPVLEIVRETATVVALVLVALATTPTLRRWPATFFLMLGISGWSYYLSLKALIGWPHSLEDWDLIFMVPLPWVGTVWAALVCYTAMIVAAAWFFGAEATGRPLRSGPFGWLLLLTGSLVTAAPFCWDVQHIVSGGYPRPFNGLVLAAGLALVLAGLLYAWKRSARTATSAQDGPRQDA